MILIKNTASQVVYAKLIDTLTGTPATGVGSGSITTYISKDGGSEATAANSVTEVGHGVYKLTLSQAETDCTTGIVNMTHNSSSQYQFETIYFQTTEANPSVNVLANNDKTGYSLSSSQTFSTTGAVGSVTDASSIITAIKASTYDGITQQSITEMLLAFLAGKAVVTVLDSTTRLISFKKRDGTTEKYNITVSTSDGSRASGGTIA